MEDGLATSGITTVVLDLDGTLVDTVADITAALNRLLGEEGRSSFDEPRVRRLVGDGAARLVGRAWEAMGEPLDDDHGAALTARFLAHYEASVSGRSRPYPGVADSLRALRARGMALAVCTNKAGRPSRRLLADLDLDRHLAAIVGGDEVPHRKPDGRHVLAAVAAVGGDPAAAAMVGDSANDVIAARAAGIPVIAVAYGYARGPLAALGADRVVERFAEVPAALADLCRRP